MPLDVADETLDRQSLGKHGFRRLSGGTASPSKGTFSAVKAINGNVTFGPGTATAEGDTLQDGDVILEGDVIPGPFSQLEVKSGVLLCFYEQAQ
jgi:hypothetical protein